jgi:hypothetical protein
MRLWRSATNPQNVDLYVLAEHRMDPTAVSVADEKPSLEFRRAPSDSTYRQVIYRTRGRGDLTGLILLGVLGVGAIAILVVLVRLAMRKPLQR